MTWFIVKYSLNMIYFFYIYIKILNKTNDLIFYKKINEVVH